MFLNEFWNIVLPYLKYVHGIFNLIVFLFFLYQGATGFRMRRKRRTEGIPAVHLIRGHRKLGPFLVIFILFGFLGGIASVSLSWGSFFLYPIHFLNGSAISALAVLTFFVSRKIRARDNTWRNVHAFIGLVILILYALQVSFGLRMLLGS